MSTTPRQLRLGAYFTGAGVQGDSWRHPEAHTDAYRQFDRYKEYAQKLEAACFDALFFYDNVFAASDAATVSSAPLSPRWDPLVLVAAFFSVIQLPFDVAVPIAVASGLKMMVMTVAVLLMLGTTRLPSLTAALVSQVKIPYEYAFMFTSALRFMPDFIAESHAVREAQICRGYVQSRNPLKRIVAYAALVEPMVLRAITRSDTMAMSLELRGFGSSRRTFTQQIAFQTRDYLMLAFLGVVTVLLILYR